MWSFFRNIGFMLDEISPPPNEGPGLCQNRPGIQQEKNNEAQNEKWKSKFGFYILSTYK